MNKKEYNKQIDEALELRNVGKIQESISILLKVFEDIPANDIPALGVVGSLFREANNLSKALYCFDRAVESDPTSPRASLGLFHTLWRMERYDDGLNELERFFSISESESHSSLLEDMREGFFGNTEHKFENPFILIKKMRETLQNALVNEDTVYKPEDSH